jgi:hypothetical protein
MHRPRGGSYQGGVGSLQSVDLDIKQPYSYTLDGMITSCCSPRVLALHESYARVFICTRLSHFRLVSHVWLDFCTISASDL